MDDDSKDGTRDILKQMEVEGLKVLYHETNLGKGAALRTGFQQASVIFVIVQDADLEYDPQGIPQAASTHLAREADVVYGSGSRGRGEHDVPSSIWQPVLDVHDQSALRNFITDGPATSFFKTLIKSIKIELTALTLNLRSQPRS